MVTIHAGYQSQAWHFCVAALGRLNQLPPATATGIATAHAGAVQVAKDVAATTAYSHDITSAEWASVRALTKALDDAGAAPADSGYQLPAHVRRAWDYKAS